MHLKIGQKYDISHISDMTEIEIGPRKRKKGIYSSFYVNILINFCHSYTRGVSRWVHYISPFPTKIKKKIKEKAIKIFLVFFFQN